jgi:hypothetical protein
LFEVCEDFCRLDMPYNYRVDIERGLVITTAWGAVTGAEALEHQRKLLNDPAFERDFFQFIDVADVTEIHIDRATVAQLARIDVFSAKSRRAFFAPSLLAFGMSRMFIAFRQESGGQEQMSVFSDRKEALQWLGISSFD